MAAATSSRTRLCRISILLPAPELYHPRSLRYTYIRPHTNPSFAVSIAAPTFFRLLHHSRRIQTPFHDQSKPKLCCRMQAEAEVMERVRSSPTDDGTKRGAAADDGESQDEQPRECVPASEQRQTEDQQVEGTTGAATGLSPAAGASEATGAATRPRKEVVESDDPLRMVDRLLEEALGGVEGDVQRLEPPRRAPEEGKSPDHGESKQGTCSLNSSPSYCTSAWCFGPLLLLCLFL